MPIIRKLSVIAKAIPARDQPVSAEIGARNTGSASIAPMATHVINAPTPTTTQPWLRVLIRKDLLPGSRTSVCQIDVRAVPSRGFAGSAPIVVAQPSQGMLHGPCIDADQLRAALLFANDKACPLQHLEMLRHGRQGHAERISDLAH